MGGGAQPCFFPVPHALCSYSSHVHFLPAPVGQALRRLGTQESSQIGLLGLRVWRRLPPKQRNRRWHRGRHQVPPLKRLSRELSRSQRRPLMPPRTTRLAAQGLVLMPLLLSLGASLFNKGSSIGLGWAQALHCSK